jgi:hypothetical protein
MDDFGGQAALESVVLGDMEYFKLLGNVSDVFALTTEEARGLLEDVARMKNRSRVFKHAWERKGAGGFDTNMESALRRYLNLSARYIAMDTLKHDGINMFERTFGRFGNEHKGLANYTKKYIQDSLGVPSAIEETLNNWVRNSPIGKYMKDIIGDRPATVAANGIAKTIAVAKLGFLNIASAAMNLTQLNGTQAIIGMGYTTRGLYEYLRPTKHTYAIYRMAGADDAITAENPSGYSKVHQARGTLLDVSMLLFRSLDGVARKATLLGAYRKAIDEGKSKQEAIAYAKKVNDDVNFDYSVADAPHFLRQSGPVGTVLFQFKKYPIKLMELALPGVGKLEGMQQVKFWVPFLAMSGLFGLPGFDAIKDLIAFIFGGKDIEMEMEREMKLRSYISRLL